MEDSKQKWEERFEQLSDSILYMNGFSKEEIETMTDDQKIMELQKLDTLTEC